MRDLISNLGVVQAVPPAVLAATTKGAAIDLQGFNSALIAISTGAIVGAGNFTAKLQESDTTTDGDFTDVDAADLQRSLPATLAASTVYRQGYTGAKRYIRAVLTLNSGTSIAAAAVAVLGNPAVAPVA